MAKEKATFRLSHAALEAIEKRDKDTYPTATEYVERSVLEFEKSEKLEQLMEKLQFLEENDREILKILRQDSPDIAYPNV